MNYNSHQKRIHHEQFIYFVTSKTYKNYPYFNEEIFCELFMQELELCKKLKKFELYAFCLLPDHFHLLLKPSGEFDISKIVKFFKENFSRDCNKIIEGDTAPCHLQIKSEIDNLKKCFLDKYKNAKLEFPKFRWQKSFHDHVIRDSKDFENHYNYVVNNYLKHNLQEDWQYTSKNYQHLVDSILI